jgi:predicted nucleotidyltransferase
MQAELLGLVLLQSDRNWTLDQLAGLLHAPHSSVHRELTRAVDAGIIIRENRRRPFHFRAAKDSPIFAPLRDLVALTVGVEARLGQALGDLPEVRLAVIHGSWASGRVRANSDIDLLVVTEGDRRTVHGAIREIGRQAGRNVDASILSPSDFNKLVEDGNPFLTTIARRAHIDLIGDMQEMTRSAR